MYGVLMTLEVIDKILFHFGEYFIIDQFWFIIPKKKNIIFSLKTNIAIITVYILIHSLVLHLLLLVYNVLLNSDANAFLIMIFVNNSVKLKSTIFKKFNEQAY